MKVLVTGHVQLFVTPWTVAHQAPLFMVILQATVQVQMLFPSLHINCLVKVISRWFPNTSHVVILLPSRL